MDKPKRPKRQPFIPLHDGLTGTHRFIASDGKLVVAEWAWRKVGGDNAAHQ